MVENRLNKYQRFLEAKKHSVSDCGIEPVYLPEGMFDFQNYVGEKLIRKGRGAGFLDTGLGKTILELCVAINYAKTFNKPVLIATPLAVAFQFLDEAKKFNLDDVTYSRDGSIKSKVVITNLERLHYFDANKFICVTVDESSILKNFDGAMRKYITHFLKKVMYRYLFSATPAPNDYIELGTSSEALGFLGYADMLTKFFRNNQNSTDVRHAGNEYYLKPHAEKDFWQWIAGWSIAMRKPSDLGFSDENYKLPELYENEIIVRNEEPLDKNGQIQLFNAPAKNFHEIKAEVKSTINARCEKAFECASAHDVSVYWVNLNKEAELLKELDKSAYEIKGDMDIDEKEEILMGFSRGEIKKLITKTSITAFGLNWQHCNHTTYYPTYSYEQYYQAIRRFWRFGQKRNVHCDLILSDGQTKIMESIRVKRAKAISMFENLIKHINGNYQVKDKDFNKIITLPKFIKEA